MQKHGLKMTTHLKAGASVKVAYINSIGIPQTLTCKPNTDLCIEPTDYDFVISCGKQKDYASSIEAIKRGP